MRLTSTLLCLALLTPVAPTFAFGQNVAPVTPPAVPATPEPHTYRLTYTLTQTDSGKKVGVQHFSMTVIDSGWRVSMKLGSRIPVATGGTTTNNGEMKGDTYQMTYLDVGLNISASLVELSNGLKVITKVEQSSVADSPLPRDPIVRQAFLDNTAMLTPGKPVLLGALDTPGSTRHLDIEVVLERVQ